MKAGVIAPEAGNHDLASLIHDGPPLFPTFLPDVSSHPKTVGPFEFFRSAAPDRRPDAYSPPGASRLINRFTSGLGGAAAGNQQVSEIA